MVNRGQEIFTAVEIFRRRGKFVLWECLLSTEKIFTVTFVTY